MAPPKRGPSVLVTDSRERERDTRELRNRQQQHQQQQQQQRQYMPVDQFVHHQRSRSNSASTPHSATPYEGSFSSAPSTGGRRMPMRFVSVDNVLQYAASDIPSAQPRGRLPPLQRRNSNSRSSAATQTALTSGRTPTAVSSGPRQAAGGGVGSNGGGSHGGGVGAASGPSGAETSGAGVAGAASAAPGVVQQRSTKNSEKLVLLPETSTSTAGSDEEDDSGNGTAGKGEDPAWGVATEGANESRPLRDDELDMLRKRGGIGGKTYAERLPKVERAEKVARLTAYCTAQAYKLKATAEFLKRRHDARTKLYDDCLYAVYHLPLLPGLDGYRLRSGPILRTPGSGKTIVDLEIEMGERRDHYEDYFDEYAIRYVGNSPGNQLGFPVPTRPEEPDGEEPDGEQPPPPPPPPPQAGSELRPDDLTTATTAPSSDGVTSGATQTVRTPPVAGRTLVVDIEAKKKLAEMFVFSYGVVVFWNFTEHQEKDILADLTFAESSEEGGRGISLVTRPLDQRDYETEEFHFEYNAEARRPRVFNDMITLLPHSDHMTKLTISHAIAQSTKLCLFEEQMSVTLLNAQHVPKRLALTGELNMTRTEIVRILGRLFRSRVDINLSSNILDVPNFFWDSEPTLHPLYSAVREYLEIDRRTRVLNERCRVFLDLAEILSDAIADDKMSSITWTIIVLICISIVVTVTEVVLRFAIISGERNSLAPPAVIDPVQQAAVLQLVGSGSHPHVRPALPPGCVCPSIGAGLPGP